MGDCLSPHTLQSFQAEVEFLDKLAELHKKAAIPNLSKYVGQAGRMLSHGVESLGRSAGRGLGNVGKSVTGLPEAGRETLQLAANPLKSIKKGWKESRWMGDPKGKITKYLPIGMKSMTMGFAAPGLYDAYKATKEAPTPTGEGGTAERLLGEVGGTGGMLAGMASKRFLPGMALMMAGQYTGGKMGRIIDRLRGGANLSTAVGAPSPTEASEQLENIQRYYG